MAFASNKPVTKNTFPRWKGFNLLDYFSPVPGAIEAANSTTEDDFKWMADWGFDFVRSTNGIPKIPFI